MQRTAPPAPARGLPSRPGPLVWALYALILVFSMLQAPLRVTLDTRLELSTRPSSFLGSAFSLWQPSTNFGELQNQAYGYLFPQGTFFVLADLARLPDWVAQRVWTALVLVVALEGARRCALAAGLDRPVALVAGLAFAFSPRLLGTVGVISAESLPGAVLPWVVLPVLLALAGRLSPGRAALLSGAAVVCMGGVNAVENAGSLPLPAILVGWAAWRGLVPRRFVAQWVGAVLAASLWWVVPLLTLARYSPPFYEYVESAANTTAVIGWSEALRGDSHWVAYIVAGDRPWWPAAFDLAFTPHLVLVAGVVSAVGLVGLLRFPTALRTPLTLSLVLGLTAITVAHGGWEGSPLSASFRTALDGPLQIFRNVHKIDPVVRLPVALGFAQAAALAVGYVVTRRRAWVQHRAVLLAVPGCLLLVLGQPFLDNHVRTPGWTDVPRAWHQAHDYLAARQDGTATLVVPGSGFALQDWGWTYDEPFLALGTDVRWVSRSQIPIVPGQTIRVLSALDALLVDGRGSPELGDELARAGIGHVLVRRDLMRDFTGSPHPAGATVALATAGLRPAAGFGSVRDGGPEVEIYEVASRLPRVRSTAVDSVLTVAGTPESSLGLVGAGVVDPDTLTVLSGEDNWDHAVDVVTDGDQRRERAFGRVTESVSAVMSADEPYRNERTVPDYPGAPRARQVVAAYRGLDSLTASSSQGYADAYGAVVPQGGPYAAVDGDERTRWVTSLAGEARRQWIRLGLAQPTPVRQVRVRPVMDDPAMAPIRELQVVAGDQVRTLRTNPTGTELTATFSGADVDSVEVRVTRVATPQKRMQVAISEISVDGLKATRSLRLPDDVDRGAGLLLGSDPGARACRATGLLPDCDVVRIRDSEEPDGLSRSFETPDGAELDLGGLVVARSTREAAQLLEPFLTDQQVGATSVYGADPLVASRFAYDGDLGTQWVAAEEDPQPTLFFRWSSPRLITGLRLPAGDDTTPGFARVVVRGGGRIQQRVVTGDRVTLKPVATDLLEVSFVKTGPRGRVVVPEIELTGGEVTTRFHPDAPTGAACGLGPRLVVDGRTVDTTVSGTLGDVVNGAPMRFTACRQKRPDRTVTTSLTPGQHTLRAVPTSEFEVVSVTSPPAERPSSSGGRDVTVGSWGVSRRTLRVGAGEETLIAVPENFNAGWVATAGGATLEPVRVDGWQQGWVVPAGDALAVDLDFAPQRGYALLLRLGLGVSALVLLAGLFLIIRRRRPVATPLGLTSPQPWGRVARVVTLVLTTLLVGWVAAGAVLASWLWSRRDLLRLELLLGALVVASAALDAWPQVLPASVADGCAVAAVGLFLGLVARGRPDEVTP